MIYQKRPTRPTSIPVADSGLLLSRSVMIGGLPIPLRPHDSDPVRRRLSKARTASWTTEFALARTVVTRSMVIKVMLLDTKITQSNDERDETVSFKLA